MRLEEVRNFFQRHAEGMVAGPLDWLDEVYQYPMSVFVDHSIFVELSPEDTRRALLDRREDYAKAGLPDATVLVEVLELTEQANDRFSATVATTYSNPAGGTIAKTLTRFLCLRTEHGTIKIESLELLHRDVPSRAADAVVLH